MEEFIAEQHLPMNATTEAINENVSRESFTRRMLEAAIITDKYYTPLLCLLGALGNALSLAVFCTDAKYRSQSASFYLSALAISDTGFLLSLFAVWLEGVLHGGGVITSSDFSCSLVMYIGQVTGFLSVYLTVAFSIERYVAVHYPFSRPRVCTRAKAKKAIACLTVTALVIFSYTWVIAKVIRFPSFDVLSDIQDTSRNDYDVHSGHEKDGREVKANHSSWDNFPYSQDGSSSAGFLLGEDIMNLTSYSANFHDTDADLKMEIKFDGEEPHRDFIIPGALHHANDVIQLNLQNSTTMYTNAYASHSASPADAESTQKSHFNYYCTVPENYFKVSEIANYCDTAITLLIPFFLITFFNIQIATCVWRLKSQRQSIVATPSREYSGSRRFSVKSNVSVEMTRLHTGRVIYRPSLGSRNVFSDREVLPHNKDSSRSVKFEKGRYATGPKSSLSKRSDIENAPQPILRSRLTTNLSLPNDRPARATWKCHYTSPEVRVTKTLLLVSSVFLVLNLPSHVIRCAQFIQKVTGTDTRESQGLLHALQAWTNFLFNTNFAVNFLLYCVSGKNFRLSLHNLFLRTFRRGRMTHHRRKVIKERLHPASRCCSTTLTTGARESCATSYLRIELENVDKSFFNGSSLNCMDEDIEEIVPV